MLPFNKYFLALCSLGLFIVAPAHAQTPAEETITSFHSNIIVNADGWLDVTETIEVYSLGVSINHGIYRDFPTTYRQNWFVKTVVPFELVSTTRDGLAEPYHTERQSNGIRVYLGSEDVIILPGAHIYTITYRTNPHPPFF